LKTLESGDNGAVGIYEFCCINAKHLPAPPKGPNSVRNFYTYADEHGQKLHGYERRYKKRQLRKRGFATKGAAEADLRQAMDDIDAELRGEIRVRPTTMQEALGIYRRKLEVRGRDKPANYNRHATSVCRTLEGFVNRFGPDRLVREVTQTDLREFYQTLCFQVTRNSAGVTIGYAQGMLKAAQEAKADLVNWLRPTLTVKRETEFERRVVEPWEYVKLVQTLLSPPPKATRCGDKARKALWRDAADTVQLLRLTGGRLNEVLRLRLGQFYWDRWLDGVKGFVRLKATKTETERDIPLWGNIREIIEQRIREHLASDELVFARATTEDFDQMISSACRIAGKTAELSYGRAHGFTCHSFRHTFTTDLMEKTGNDVGTVMRYTGHKTIESFSIYLKPTDKGRLLATQTMNNVALFLRSSENHEHVQHAQNAPANDANVLNLRQVAG
jgi:integrase